MIFRHPTSSAFYKALLKKTTAKTTDISPGQMQPLKTDVLTQKKVVQLFAARLTKCVMIARYREHISAQEPELPSLLIAVAVLYAEITPVWETRGRKRCTAH